MNEREKPNVLIDYTKEQLASREFKVEHRTAPEHFTREGNSPLCFLNTAMIVLNMIKKPLKVELMDFFYEFFRNLTIPSRQALSQARDKISYLAFKDFFEKSCELTVNDTDAKLYKGYRLFAADGTSFIVGKLSKLAEYFSESTAIAGKAMCRIGAIVDVLEDCIVSATVAPFNIGERALAIEQVKKLSSLSNALFLFDRGYWSPDLIKAIVNNGQKFVMRLASNAGKTSITDDNGNEHVLRRYSFILPSGIEEVLLTNMSEAELTNDELAKLYARRWGVETKYLELKARLQIDKFSGQSANVILQDIYSTLYISNLVAFICSESDKTIAERTANKENKYPQKTNRAVAIAALRRRFIEICFTDNRSEVDSLLQKFYDDICRSVTPVGKSKSRPRNKRQMKESRKHYNKPIL